MTKVREFMNPDPVTARPEMTLSELVELFDRHGVRGLAVTAEEGRLVGVVTETDLFLKAKGVPFSIEKIPTLLGRAIEPDKIEGAEAFRRVRVEEVMTRNVVTVDEEATLEKVAMLMHHKRVTMIPVIADDHLVGEVRRIHVLRGIYCER